MIPFATKDKPIRASYLSWVARCSMKPVLDMVDDADTTGAAAQIGSVVHAGIAAFHLTPGEQAARVAAAFEAARGALQQYPLADENECRLFLTPYCADPRNAAAIFARVPAGYTGGGHPDAGRIKAGQPAIELPVRFQLKPHRLDPTGEAIWVDGTLDQLRMDGGKPTVCDAKTGQPTGLQMLHDYAYQIAAYTLGARQCGWPDTEPGEIIRLRRYRERNAALPNPSGVHWSMPFTAADCEMLLDTVRLNVALIRSGNVTFGAGVQCTYCPHRGLDGCIPKAKQKLGITLA